MVPTPSSFVLICGQIGQINSEKKSGLTLVGLGCQNYVKTWGGDRSALPFKNSKIRLKTIFSKVCHGLHYIKIIIVKVGHAKEKLLKKKVWRKNPRGGGRSAPP